RARTGRGRGGLGEQRVEAVQRRVHRGAGVAVDRYEHVVGRRLGWRLEAHGLEQVQVEFGGHRHERVVHARQRAELLAGPHQAHRVAVSAVPDQYPPAHAPAPARLVSARRTPWASALPELCPTRTSCRTAAETSPRPSSAATNPASSGMHSPRLAWTRSAVDTWVVCTAATLATAE